MIALKKILVATDFGPAAESALIYGRALARGFGAALHVLHVTENVYGRAMNGYGYATISPEIQETSSAPAANRPRRSSTKRIGES